MTNDTSFDGRCALVTGATSGIGEALAKRLLSHGAKVVATGRRADRLAALQDEVGASNLHTVPLDMTDLAAVDAFPASLPEAFSPDILVNNAGLSRGLEPAQAAVLADWDEMIATNISGLVHMTRAVLPRLIEKPRADVLNLSSIAGSYPYPGGNTYGATKAFVTQFSLNLRADLLGTNVRVTSVEPGMTETEFSVVRFKGDQAKADKVYEGATPMTGDDIARVVTDILALPPHVNINRVEIMPVGQAFSPFAIDRG